MRYVFFGLVGLVALLVGAAAVGPAFVDWSRYKDDISTEVHRATGRTLLFDGALNLSILPSPRFSAENLRIIGQPGSRLPDMARVKGLQVHLRLMPLLQGEIQVASMTLVEPEIVFAVAKDGRSNWDALAAPRRGAPAAPPGPAPAAKSTGASVRLDNLEISNGTAIYRDAASGTERRLNGIMAELSAQSLSGPFSANGEMESGGVPLEFDAQIGALNGGGATAELALTLKGTDGEGAVLKGRIEGDGAASKFVGTIASKAADFENLATALAGAPVKGSILETWKKQPFDLKGRVEASPAAITVNDMALRLGTSRATGGISATLGKNVQADIALKVRRLDLDRLMRAMPASRPAASRSRRKAASGPLLVDHFFVPKNIAGSIDLSIESITLRKRQIRNFRFSASQSAGKVTVRRAVAGLPGGTRLSVSGFVAAKAGRPHVEGKVSAKAADLRALLDWLKIDVGAISSDRLRKFEAKANVKTARKRLQISNLDLRLDASRIKGAVTYLLQARPSFGATLSVDRVNLDAYLPPPATAGAKKSKAAAKKGTAKKGAAKQAAAKRAAGKKGAKKGAAAPPVLAFLKDFDANLVVGINRLTYRRTAIQGVQFNGALVAGKLTLKKAAVRNLGGTRVSLAGSVTGFGGFPAFNGSYSADAANISGLFRILGIEPVGNPARLGGIKLAGKAKTGPKQILFDSTLALAGGQLSLAGQVRDYRDSPAVDLTVSANHPDYRKLGALFGTKLPVAKGLARKVTLSGKVTGPPETLTVDAGVKMAGIDARLTGKLNTPIETKGVDLKLVASHREFVRVARLFAPDYRPSAKSLGPAKLAAQITGTPQKLSLAGLRFDLGPARLTGKAEVDSTGVRPAVVAVLTGTDILLDPLLPADPKRKKTKAPKGGKSSGKKGQVTKGQFSRERLDLSGLGAMDADVTVEAASLTREKIRIGKPRLHAVLKDRVLTIDRAEGSIFGGTFKLTGKVSGKATPAIDGKLTLRQAKLKKALFEAGDIDVASGTIDLDLSLAGSGRSEQDLVAHLNGQGTINGRDGVISGFNLRAVSDRLKKLRQTEDFFGLLSAGMGGGATPYSRLTGTFTVKNGVVTTNDLKLVADGGEGTAKGAADLPRWAINMMTNFRLVDHPKAPPFGMRLRGRLDEPRRFFEFQDMQAFLLRRSVDTFLKKVLPGATKPRVPAAGAPKVVPKAAPAPPARTAPPVQKKSNKIRAEDILRGLLPGLKQ